MKLPSLNLLDAPPSTVRAMSGQVSTITLLDGRNKSLPNPLATLGRICQPGRVSVPMVEAEVGAVEAPLTTVPEVPRTIISTNDNYYVMNPVRASRTMNLVLTDSQKTFNAQQNVNYSVVCPVHFVINKIRQPQNKGLNPHRENKVPIKSVNFVSFVDHCVFVPTVPNVLSVVHAPQVGGHLQNFWQTWARLGANPRVVSVLKEGYVLPFKVKPPLVRHPLIVSGYANAYRNLSLREAVQSLINKEAVEMVRVRASLAFFNRLFIVPKPNQKWHPVLDLSALNKFLCIKTFKIETPETIRISLQQGEWVSSLDFSDAYFHIPNHIGSRKYLRFHFQNQSFQFRALPFGLSTAPMEFTYVVKEVKLMAQSRGIRIHQ